MEKTEPVISKHKHAYSSKKMSGCSYTRKSRFQDKEYFQKFILKGYLVILKGAHH